MGGGGEYGSGQDSMILEGMVLDSVGGAQILAHASEYWVRGGPIEEPLGGSSRFVVD